MVPDSSIRGASKDLVATSAKALDVSGEQLDFPHLPGNCSGHVPLAEEVATAAAGQHAVCQLQCSNTRLRGECTTVRRCVDARVTCAAWEGSPWL